MSRKETQKLSLCIALAVAYLSFALSCTDMEWKCLSGQCIDSDDLCDGTTNCADGSDETAEFCIHQSCPAYAFRCAYGACVNGEASCNGKKECADNSDETTGLCSSDISTRNSRCKESEQFECTSGECIDQDDACDGHADCSDQSDETVEACASNICAKFAFRCGYGACISKMKTCDGEIDCRDGSDESFSLCGTRSPPTPPVVTVPTRPGHVTPPTKPTPTPTRRPAAGCVAPTIPNSIIVYEYDESVIVNPGQKVPDQISISFRCRSHFSREGLSFNLCYNSTWQFDGHTECIKYCPNDILKGVTFNVKCLRGRESVACDNRIKAGTVANVGCALKYSKPNADSPDNLVCHEGGDWDYPPYTCQPICGEELVRSQSFLANAPNRNITYVPWHVGIYKMSEDNTYRQVCGGTIINAKIVISAAHCFWNKKTRNVDDKSLYKVGAGKYYRDYYHEEPEARFENIAKITIDSDYKDDLDYFKADIAVLVMNNFFVFSPFIAPICIEWQQEAAKSIESSVYGRVPGWGLTENREFSEELRAVDVRATSYSDCIKKIDPELVSNVKQDKFCVLNESGSTVCQGDSGGGFVVKKRDSSGRYRYYLWGVVSGGVPYGRICTEYDFASYTNIQFYENMIKNEETTNRPR